MAIGQRMGSLKTLKKSLAKGGSGSAWIKYIPKNGSMNVRFIEEPENWINYVEHYDQTIRKSYPCNNEDSCPGCQTKERKSARYLTNAVDVDSDRVIPLQLPKDLANRLVVRYEKNGSLTDRDFELSRSGEGLDTVYDLDPGMPDKKKLDKYKPLDLLKVLEDAYEDVFGQDDEDKDTGDLIPKMKRAPKKSSAAAAIGPDPTQDRESAWADPTVEDKPKKKGKVPDPVFTPDVDDDDDVDAFSDGDIGEDDDEGYTVEELRAMKMGALRAVARDFEIDPKGMDAEEIIEAIMSSGEPVDDEPPF